MATSAEPIATVKDDARFFARFNLAIAVLIVFAFAQFTLRGLSAPLLNQTWAHVHAAAMIAWLALVVMQSRYAAQGRLANHRRLGWIGAYLVVIAVATGCYAGIAALRTGIYAPFFTGPYFLALTQVGSVVFGGMVFAAITRRKQTDYHRRLIAGSMIAITEPAFGRLLPMPLMIGWSGWAILAIQLGLLGIVALHDRRTLGRIHIATATSGAIIAMTHVLIEVSARNPDVVRLAASIASG